jgi:recombination protein RecA
VANNGEPLLTRKSFSNYNEVKGDTVGSREFTIFTQRQEQILLGTLLGDGFLEQNGHNVRLKIDHGAKQKAYVFWLYKEFKTIARMPYQLLFQDKRTSQIYEHWRFATYSLPLLNPWRQLFYHNKRKIISPKIFELLSPLSLAVWYMDDGFRRTDCKGLYLCTSAYSMEEQYFLQECLEKKFNIQTKLHFAAKQVRIYVPSSQTNTFCSIVQPFILPSFTYKLFDPVTTDSLVN